MAPISKTQLIFFKFSRDWAIGVCAVGGWGLIHINVSSSRLWIQAIMLLSQSKWWKGLIRVALAGLEDDGDNDDVDDAEDQMIFLALGH